MYLFYYIYFVDAFLGFPILPNNESALIPEAGIDLIKSDNTGY